MALTETGYGKYEWEIRECSTATKLGLILKQNYKNLEPVEWLKVFQNQHFFQEIYKLYEKYIPWEYIVIYRKIPMEYLEKHFDEISLYECSAFQPLTAAFIKKHKDVLSLDVLAKRDDLDKDAKEMAQKMYRLNNDPTHHRRWDQNLMDATNFCPKNFNGHYRDYQTPEELKLIEISNKKVKEESKKEVLNSKKTTNKVKKPQKQKIILDYSSMKKSELKQILSERKVRVYYHDTLEILIRKCKESEVL